MVRLIKIYLIVLLFAMLGSHTNDCQAQDHVYTKSISRNVLANKRTLIIDAEKADISISESTTEFIEIELKLISKHSDKSIAEKQISYMKHILNVKNKEVFLRNYILVNAGEELTGIVQAEYAIKVPKNKTIIVSNSLGQIIIDELEGNFTLNTKYGNISLYHIKGELAINANIGEIILKNCELKSYINTKYISSYYQNCSGYYSLTTNLGSVNFGLNKSLNELKINATGTEVTLSNKNCIEFNLDLITQSGKLFLHECNLPNKSFLKTDSRESLNERKEVIYYNPKLKSTINIRNKFSNISIQ